MIYASGVWSVKTGREDDFARYWQASVDEAALELPGVVFRLLRDVDRPGRFMSLTGPWKSLEQLTAMRESDEFKQSMASAQELLEGLDVSTYELVVEVS